ncbi:iron complex outermembrane receptor protein [Brevundimonas alba]|uniref:Iron complex outermembrane receptor protein n=1 Tax=Brevundimonas alba TaxID=74314 RepID=A0A7X6BP90_9CAUL|nr:TonB-dependent receptor [Brevundimonas alba]NJC41271.1 iron complex outermembrane receptor protein [Brevundimonas alba]
MRTQVTRRARLLGGAALGAVAALAFTGTASAQDAPQDATQVDEIVVTGIRSSIESSIASKRTNDSIVEVVTAEDIGKLPDVSIAESLARLPGLTAQRLDGRGQVISIRGLSPDFTTALLNGREQVSAGDNRGVEFDQYPSELLGSVLVYKTPDAALIGQGLAGTADLRTIRPLEYGRQAIALNARYEWNDYGALNSGTEDTGQRYSISYIDQFMDGALGVVLGYAHLSTPYQAERFNAWGYPGDNAVAQPNLVIGGAKPYVQSSELVRDGYMATVEFRPNDRWHSTFDAFYSEFDNTQILRGIEFPLAWGGSSGACPGPVAVCRPGPQLQPGFTVEDGIVTAGTFTNVKGVVRNDGNRRTAELTSVGWNNEFQLDDNWAATIDVSYSKADRTDTVLETNAGTGRNIDGALDTLSFVTTPEGTTFTSTLDYSDPSLILLTSPQGWGGGVFPAGIPGGQDGFINSPSIVDELQSIRGEVGRDYDEGPFSRFEFGFNVTSRDKELTLERYYLVLAANAADPLHNTSVPVPSQFLLEPTQLSYLGLGGMISYDPFALAESGIYNLVAPQDDNLLAFGWSVSETVSTGYWKADIGSEMFGMPLTGNMGFQVVHTDQSSDGTVASGNPATPVPVSGGDEYTYILPSMNLNFEVHEDLYVRIGLAREMARPRMDQMRASINIDYNAGLANSTDINNGPWGGSGGNPNLRPWIANAADISIEKYFGRRGYVSLALFYKDLQSYIYDQRQIADFTGYPVTGPQPVLRQGIINTPQNGEGGEIQGAEFAVSVPFDMFWEPLEGFGMTFSASYTDSNIIPNPGSPSTPLPGLSEKVGNLTVYYERDGFQARISNRYRSEFLGELSGVGTDRIQRMVDAESVVDAQIGYEFQSGPLEGLSALFQVNNLTDEQFKTFENNDDRRVIDFQQYGRTYLVGVNYRY